MPDQDQDKAGPIDPDEVIPPQQPGRQPENSIPRRLEHAFGPVIAGLIIDLVDLATFGPVGLLTGMVIGGAMAYWICSIYGIPARQRWIWVLLAGVYCTIPATTFIPLATLAGAFMRYRTPPVRR